MYILTMKVNDILYQEVIMKVYIVYETIIHGDTTEVLHEVYISKELALEKIESLPKGYYDILEYEVLTKVGE